MPRHVIFRQKDKALFFWAKNKHKIDTFFSMCNVSPDFIEISETKLKSKCCTNTQIPNYNFVHVDSLTNAGGVGLYVNKNCSILLNKTWN